MSDVFMINYFHLIYLVGIYLIWLETIPFIRNYDLEDKIKLLSKLIIVVATMVLILWTYPVTTLLDDFDDPLDVTVSTFNTGTMNMTTFEHQIDVDKLLGLMDQVKVKYTLKFPKKSYIGYTVRVMINSKEGISYFQVTDENYIWFKGKFYKCTNFDLYTYLMGIRVSQVIKDVDLK